MNKAVFLDRDGVINEDKAYVHKIEDFEFCKGVFGTLKHLQDLGYMLIVVTNQSGIGRGYYSEEDFGKLTSWMRDELLKRGIEIKDVLYCPHKPDEGCACRKPEPQMIKDAIKNYNIDKNLSWMIGDKKSDIQAANNAGIKDTIYIDKKFTCKEAKYSVQEILDIIPIIKK